jgi:signal transduction histidine kinase
VSSAVGERLPGWSLQVQLTGADPLSAAESRKAAYLWTGGAGIVLIAVLAAAVAGLLGRQMRLTRLKNDLIATVSHELKTPLASMRMLVDTLLEGRYRDAGQVREYLQLIAGQNVRLSRLIDNFLTFSRMERNKRAFEFAPLRVEDIVAAAVEAAQERFSGPGCTLQVQIQSDLPSITGDRDALTTVLLNLLDNAHKYTGDTKCVTVRGSLQDGQIVLSVADNGIGIPRRALRRIFDRFYQVDQSLSRRAGGCGLGLSIVQFIVAAHGGTVTVTSEPGKGSCFSVRLPANV